MKLAVPVMFSQLGQVTVQFADNAMVGQVGVTELAAVAFANNIFVIGMLLGVGICMGLTPLTGQAFLRKNGKQLASYLKNSTALYLAVGLFIALVLTALSFFLDHMGQTPQVAEMAQPYLWVLIISLLPLMLFSTFKQFLEGLGNTKVAMVITVAANLINILLNYLLIYGKWGCPQMGALGAGVATMTSRFLMAIAILLYFKFNKQFQSIIDKAKSLSYKLSEMKHLLQIGLPIGVQVVFEVFMFSLAGIMMGWIGEKELAAHQIAFSITTMSYMISIGIGSAETIRVSHNMAIGDFKQIKRLIFATAHLTIALMCSMGLLFIVARHLLPSFFTNDQEVIQIAASLLIMAAVFQLSDSLQVALLAALRGITDVNIPMLLAFLTYIVIGVPTCYFFAFTLEIGPIGIWIGLFVSLSVAAVLFSLRLRYKIKRLEEAALKRASGN